MKKEEKQLIITGVAILVFVTLLVNMLVRPKKRRAAIPPSSPALAKARLPATAGISEEQAEKRGQAWGRNPFILGEMPFEGVGRRGLALNGIMWDSERPYAVINDEIVGKGDTVNGHTVLEIQKERVILEKDEEQITLSLWE